jgi:hypothetical protein
MKIVISILGVLLSFSCFSQVLTETQALDLGTVVVASNDSVNTVSIDKEGNYRTTGGIYVIEIGEPSIFEASGFAGNQRLNITVTAGQSTTTTAAFSPQQFNVQSYQAQDFINTNAQGIATFLVGAVFATSGNGSINFRDTQYTANYTVTINF